MIDAGRRHLGDITCDGTIQIDGQIAGELRANRIVVGKDGIVDGKIAARTVHVDGTVRGSVSGDRVSLGPTARIAGDVVYDTLSISNGASISGHCQDRAAENAEPQGVSPSNSGEVLPFNIAKAACRKSVGHFLLRNTKPISAPPPVKSMRAIWDSYQAARSRG